MWKHGNTRASKRLNDFCAQFELPISKHCWGFEAGGASVLYRFADTYNVQKNPDSREHWRWKWKNPLGKTHEGHSHILLHGPECAGGNEQMFIFTRKELAALARKWSELQLVAEVPVNPREAIQKKQQAILDRGMSVAQFRSWLVREAENNPLQSRATQRKISSYESVRAKQHQSALG